MNKPRLTRGVIRLDGLSEWLGEQQFTTVVQVGIGRGLELPILRKAMPAAAFIGFEALPEAAALAALTYPGTIVPMAVTDGSQDKVTIWRREGRTDASSLYPRENKCDIPYEVATTTLDTYFQVLPVGRTLLWLDAEGSEPSIIKGATKFLACVDVIVTEVSFTSGNRPGWPTRDALYEAIAGRFVFAFHTLRVGDVLVRPNEKSPPQG